MFKYLIFWDEGRWAVSKDGLTVFRSDYGNILGRMQCNHWIHSDHRSEG